MIDVFKYENYKHYLKDLMPRGARTKLSEALGCQLSFLSIALSRPNVHFSPEHGKTICEFFGLTSEETNYFLLLLLRQRAGSRSLEKYFGDQIIAIRKEREKVRSRITARSELSQEDQAIYYSEWYFSALHMILRNKSATDLPKISEVLNVPLEKLNRALEFFVRIGLVKLYGKRYEVLDLRIHIDENSPWLSLHHRNWRQRTIQLQDSKRRDDMNFTMVTSLTDEVAASIRTILLKAIQDSEPLIKAADDKAVYNLNIDLQKIF